MLSNAELKVKNLVVKGRSNAHVAAELNVSEKTVKFHLSNIFKKLGVVSRSELIAQELGGAVSKEKEIVLENLDQGKRQTQLVAKSQ